MRTFTFVDAWAWLQRFEDHHLVMVLAAHSAAPSHFSEFECADRTKLDRKTIRKKRDVLIQLGVLSADPGETKHDPRGVRWRFHWDQVKRLLAASSEQEVVLPSPSSEREVVLPSPSSEQEVVLPSPSSEREVVLPSPSSYKERARAPVLPLIKNSINELIRAEAAEPKPETNADVRRTIELVLKELAGDPLDDWTVKNLATQVERLPEAERNGSHKALYDICLPLRKPHAKTFTWGWVVKLFRSHVERTLAKSERKPSVRETHYDPGAQGELWQPPAAAQVPQLAQQQQAPPPGVVDPVVAEAEERKRLHAEEDEQERQRRLLAAQARRMGDPKRMRATA